MGSNGSLQSTDQRLDSMAKDMHIGDKATAKEWFQVIEDGVPEDLAEEWLEREATSREAPKEYGESWRAAIIAHTSNTRGLNKAECIVLLMYTMDKFKFYRMFNSDCRQRNWKCYKIYTSLLQSGLSKLRRKSSDDVRTLYRGLQCDGVDDVAGELYMSSFTSTTLSQSTAKKFGPSVLTVESRTGPAIEEFSKFCEQETLFSPFQVFFALADKASVVLQTSINDTLPFLVFPLFRGSLLGAVVGNCIGAPFEFKSELTIEELLRKLFHYELNSAREGSWHFTSDTSMILALAESLVRAHPLDIRDVSKSLSAAFMRDRNRRFGTDASLILEELHRQTPSDDPFAPAQRVHNGSGSFGNGGAMRIVPAALLNWNATEQNFNDAIGQITRLTHSHIIAINGAILQALAVQTAVKFSIYEERNQNIRERFLDQLIKAMKKSVEISENRPFCDKLMKVKDFLSSQPSKETIQKDLGSGVSADKSVPAAIYCFLRAMHAIPGIPENRTEFERTVIYAISLGGDTDTIASMAGAIAGAYYGQDSIPQRWRDICEAKAIDDAKRYAKEIHGLVHCSKEQIKP